MKRVIRSVVRVVGPLAVAGCGLLVPYPGGGDPKGIFELPGSGIDGEQDPLLDPPTDDSLTVIQQLESAKIGLPGESFRIQLGFEAPMENVVGGGIRFEGSDEVQWTLLNSVMGESSGSVGFSYELSSGACDDLTNICHELTAEEFVISDIGGEFHVSEPKDVTIILNCSTCDSQVCADLFVEYDLVCQTCVQPSECEDVFESCFAPGADFEGSDEADVFETFLGPDGVLWSSDGTCAQGKALCESFDTVECKF